MRKETIRLGVLFGMFYFVQGVAEPTEGLITQPASSLLRAWGYGPAAITGVMALLGFPWIIKPVYGLLTDFVPIFGYRRKSWLLVTTVATSLALFAIWLLPTGVGEVALLVSLLMFPAVGVAFSDVVVDALMVEKGQPLGLTGVLQSVQWGAAYGATILVGVAGGEMSRHGLQKEAFALCGGVTLVTAILVLFFVREERVARRGAGTAVKDAIVGLWNAARSRVVLGVGAFLFLFYFNPFSFSLLYNHMTGALHFGEEVYGRTVSIGAVGSVAACLVFGAICRRLSLGALIHASIVLGIVSTLCYMALSTELSAYVIAFVAQFALMIATLVTLDLAARAAPPEQAGTVFALLMSLSNASPALSTGIGGQLYDAFRPSLGDAGAFRLLVAIGAAATALSWLLVPILRRLPLEARE